MGAMNFLLPEFSRNTICLLGNSGKMGGMGGNVGGWLHKHVVYECLCFMYVCVVQLYSV